jgi:AraC-like DNA-binding protein
MTLPAKPKLTRRPLDEHLPSWGVLLLESHHDVGFSMQPRTHSFLKILYVLQGSGSLVFEKSKESFEAGDCLFVPPGTSNRIEDNPTAASSLYICCVATSLLEFDSTLLSHFPIGKLKSDRYVANRVASHLRRLAYVQGSQPEHRPLNMVAETMRLIQVICDQLGWQQKQPANCVVTNEPKTSRVKNEATSATLSESQRMVMERYTRVLDERFFEATTIDAAAASVGLSRRAFTRAFNLHTGETWLRYVRRLAVEHAMRLLSETRRPITAIAFECGFNDLSTFYRQFKSHTKISPAEYRRNAVPDSLC